MTDIKKQPVIVVCGPTASGKTALAIELAKSFDGEIISADSMQIYEGLDIATAKPTLEEMQGIPHHLLSFVPMNKGFSVADYVCAAKEKISEVANRGKIPIIAGGTGLYINSLIDNVNFDNAVTDGKVRERLMSEVEMNGPEKMHNRLMEIDPKTALDVSPNNIIRVIRALEIFEITGFKFSDYKEMNKGKNSPYNACMIGLNFEDRQNLYDRIDKRVDIMIENGMLEECREVFLNEQLNTACQAIGYKELVPFFRGEEELLSCISKIKQNSRRYAKRQLTWFRRDDRINWIYLGNIISFEKILDSAKKIVAKSEIICYNTK